MPEQSPAVKINNEYKDVQFKEVSTFHREQKNWEETASDSRSSAVHCLYKLLAKARGVISRVNLCNNLIEAAAGSGCQR